MECGWEPSESCEPARDFRAEQVPEEALMPTPLIIDTDAGYDDLLAILFALGDPTVSIQAISVVYGLTTDSHLAGKVLRHMLEQSGNEGIPVYLGLANPGCGGHAVPEDWANKVCKLGWPAPQTPPLSGAVAYLAEQMSKSTPPQILALGPLTNIAAALSSQRHHHGTLRIRMMGGAFGLDGEPAIGNMGDADPPAPHSEFNVYVDPGAAGHVFQESLDIFVVPLNACSMVPIGCRFISDFQAISSDDPRTTLAKEVFNGILKNSKDDVEAGRYFAWDPLTAVTSALRKPVNMTVAVDDLGVTSSSSAGPVTVALAADPTDFRSAFFGSFARAKNC
jgi:inosine-uridine nucleoside N-ribohydrolase